MGDYGLAKLIIAITLAVFLFQGDPDIADSARIWMQKEAAK